MGPAVPADGLIYALTGDGVVHCFDAVTGEPRWLFTADEPAGPSAWRAGAITGRSAPAQEARSTHTEHVRGSRRTCSSHPAFPLRGDVADERLRTSLDSVLNSLFVSRPSIGDRSQAPPPE
ncbi:hypothetical protein [Actinoallomurus vinaceus]|uniref:hypothetical protein n=1 Tax=Actinoallomurus vinaceus TaxID=1080074 RepID=UPI003CD05E56